MLNLSRHHHLLLLAVLVILFLAFFAILPALTLLFHLLIGLAIIWVLFSLFVHLRH